MTRLREIRKKKKLTAEKMAGILEISVPYLYDLENGRRRLNQDLLNKIREKLGVSADYILGSPTEEENPVPDLDAPLNEKNRASALLKISELDSMFDLPDEVVLTMLRKVKEKFGEHTEKEPDSLSIKEQTTEYYPHLEKLVPRDEINLAEAMVKISEIAYTHKLTHEEATYLMHRAVDHYGKPEFPEETYEAAHGPEMPGQIDWNKKEEND